VAAAAVSTAALDAEAGTGETAVAGRPDDTGVSTAGACAVSTMLPLDALLTAAVGIGVSTTAGAAAAGTVPAGAAAGASATGSDSGASDAGAGGRAGNSVSGST